MKRTALMFGAALVAVLAVGACSHPNSKSSAGGAASNADGSPALGGAAARAPGVKSDVTSLSGHSGALARLDVGTAKIRTAEITVAIHGARNVAAKASAAELLATRVGGEVDADDRVSGPHAQATLQLRVPPIALQAVLQALGRLGDEKARTLSTTDVTEKVADVTSRVASARQSIARLRSLYASATKVSDVIAIESELGSREADLESLEAQQRTLTRQTSMAAITVSLETARKAPVAPAKRTGGFLGGLERGWHGFVTAAAWLATAVGTMLPFLVLAMLLALAARYAWARIGTHRPTPGPTPADG